MVEYSRHKELAIEFKVRAKPDGTYTVKGVAVHPVTGLRYDDIAPKRLTVNTQDKIAEAKRKIIFNIEDRYEKIYLAEEQNTLLSQRVTDYLTELLDKVDHAGLRIIPAWSASTTNHGAITYFLKHVMDWLTPYLDGEKLFLPVEDTKVLRELIEADVSASSKTLNEISKENTVRNHMRDTKYILDYLYRSGIGMPLIALNLESSGSTLPSNEMLKVIPSEVFSKFCSLLRTDCTKNPELVLCSVIMVHGARTSEAAGVRLMDISIRDDHADVSIFQQERNKLRIQILKTDFSRRVMIVSNWGMQLVKICAKHITDDSTGDWCYISAEELNDYIIEKLRLAGMTSTAIGAMLAELNLDAVNNVSDRISSYILRRNFASIARNLMGLSLDEVDAQLGHRGGVDITKADVRAKVVKKINRFRFDAPVAPDSWDSPISLAGAETVVVDQYNGYKIKNDTLLPVTVSVIITAREAGTTIEIGRDCEKSISLEHTSSVIDWSSTDRTVVGDLLGGDT